MEKPILNNLNILISGGSSGIGRAIAEELIDSEANVGIISRRNPEKWEEGVPQNWNIDKNWIHADLSDFVRLEKYIKIWRKQLDHGVDVLILSAVTYASDKRHNFEETTLKEWNKLFTTNTTASFILTKDVVKDMRIKNHGLIIGITSEIAYKPGPGRVGYSISKAALHSMLAGLSEEVVGTNVTVVEILPTCQVKTPGLEKRRPTGFSFEGYASPDIFRKPILHLIQNMSNKYNGKCFTVDINGECKDINGQSLI